MECYRPCVIHCFGPMQSASLPTTDVPSLCCVHLMVPSRLCYICLHRLLANGTHSMCHLFGPYGISHAPSRKVVLRFPNSRFQFRSLAVWNPGCRIVVPRFPNSRFQLRSLGVWNSGCRIVVPRFPNSRLQLRSLAVWNSGCRIVVPRFPNSRFQFRSLDVWNPGCRKVVTGFPNSRFQFRSLGVWNPGCGIAVPGFPNSRHLNSNSPTVQPVCRAKVVIVIVVDAHAS